jgi:hypothetical protein
MTRLTANQVIEKFGRDIDELTAMKSSEADWKATGIDYAAGVVAATLDPRWQAEPDAEGEHYVEGVKRVAYVYREDTEGNPWAIEYVKTDPGTLASELKWEPLASRRVCPIGERPQGGGP